MSEKNRSFTSTALRLGRKILYPLFGAVAFVLLIACVNVANLMQSRTEVRRKEYALRSALGSGRRRLVRQLFVESGLLALLGGCFGIGLTFAGIAMFRLIATEFPNPESISVDIEVLVFTLGVSVLTALLFGLAPAIQASRSDLNLALREGRAALQPPHEVGRVAPWRYRRWPWPRCFW